MISSRSQYLYVTGDDFADIDIRGELVTNTTRARYPPRGEDPAFLMESVAERMMALGGSVNRSVVPPFTKFLDDKVGACNDWFRARATDGIKGFGFLNPNLDTSANAPTTEYTDPSSHNVSLGTYRDNFPNISDANYYPATPVGPSTLHKLVKADVRFAFDNQRSLVRCFRAAELTQGIIYGNDWKYEDCYYIDGHEEERIPKRKYVGESRNGEFLRYYSGRFGNTVAPYIPGGTIRYAFEDGRDGRFTSDGIGLTAVGLPPGCKCWPVLAWRFEQHWCDYPKEDNPLGYYATHFGYCCGSRWYEKVAGNAASNTLTWKWSEMVDGVPEPDWRYWLRPWHYVNEIPTDASFKKSDGTYAADYIVRDEFSVWCWPVGVIVTLGDHTKWW